MAIRLIALDMDGTSVLSNQTISNRVVDAIKRAQLKEIKVIFASGRWHNAMKMHYPTIGTTGAQINCNGSTIIDVEGNVISKVSMNYEESSSLIRELEELAIPHGVCDLLDMYASSQSCNNDAIYRSHCICKDNLHLLPYISKITIANKSSAFYNHLKNDFISFNVEGAQEGHIEVWPKTTSKAVALASIASLYAIQTSECLAVGDGSNDIEMLKWAGIGVAMGNGSDEVKRSANVTGPSLENDGVAWAIENYALV